MAHTDTLRSDSACLRRSSSLLNMKVPNQPLYTWSARSHRKRELNSNAVGY